MKRVLAQNVVRLMLGGVTAGLLTVVEIPNPVALLSLVTEARAATDVSISISTFYDELSSHGDWVSYRGATVFVPVDVADDWRPYTLGHWVYTEQYGWLWVSDEPFGWATYHYGRWGYADDIGWYWVPGTRWGPAWVSWRREREHIIWAPLPPRRDPDLISIEVTIDTTPDFYWVVVPTREFLAEDISVVVIRDEPEFVRIVEAAEPAGDVTIQNNVVINKVIDVDVIEKETNQQVTVVEVSETEAPAQAGKLENNTVTVFEGEVKADPDAKPAELKDIEEVKQVQAGRKSKPTEGAATTEQAPATDEEVKPEETAKPEKPTTEEQPAAEQEQAEPEQAAKPEKPKAEEQPAAEQEQAEPEQAAKPEKPKAKEQPAAEQEQAEPEQAAKPEKPKAKEQPAAEQQQAEPEQAAKPEKPKAEEQPAAEQQQAEPEQAAEPKPQKQENKACDPQTGANC